jgi:hypothetical protein
LNKKGVGVQQDNTAKNPDEDDKNEEIDTQSENEVEREEQPKIEISTLLEKTFHFVLEMIAIFDLVGDIFVLIAIIKLGHYMWSVLTFFQIASPFFICYAPLINYWVQKGSFGIYESSANRISFKNKALGFMVLTPIFVIYLVVLDLLFMINTAVLRPLVYLLKLLTFNKLDLTRLTLFVNDMYSLFFDMDIMEVEGFRRLRTISQLTFESLPQIIL